MTPGDFLEERRRVTAPVRSDTGSPGGLIPTQFVDFEDEDQKPNFMTPPKPPKPKPRRPAKGEEAESEESEEPEFSSDVCEGDDKVDRMLFRGCVRDTFGRPLQDCFVAVDQDGRSAGSFTKNNGMFEILIERPVRTPKGEQQAKEIKEKSADVLTAPPPPAPEPGRTAHVDVQVTRGGDVLTQTRLYFQDVPSNANDAFWNGTRIIQELGADFASFDIIVNA